MLKTGTTKLLEFFELTYRTPVDFTSIRVGTVIENWSNHNNGKAQKTISSKAKKILTVSKNEAKEQKFNQLSFKPNLGILPFSLVLPFFYQSIVSNEGRVRGGGERKGPNA